MDTQDAIGKIIGDDQRRDAIHIAVAPVIAAENLKPGQHVGLAGDSEHAAATGTTIGIVDPFLTAPVKPGQRFFMFLYPNTIKSLRHEWTHPAFGEAAKSASEQWMRAWAVEHVGDDYYGDGGKVGEEAAYAFAIRAGYDLSVGPYESARDHIDNEWWAHWEAITGGKGQRGEYFRCAC
jgi:hypothetical protein